MKAVLITSSILILLAAALRPVLRGRIDPRVQYALWLAAALRLLIPVNFVDSAYSALALLERAEEPAQIAQAIGQTAMPVPPMSYEDAFAQALYEYEQNGNDTSCLGPDQMATLNTRAQELQAEQPTLSELAETYARPVWLGGAAIMGLWFLLVNLRLRRRLRWALPVAADCPLPVRVTPELPSPCLCGVVRPTIYVTPAVLEAPDRLRHVLAHELTHCRHRDHWWALVRCLCLCLYWFDPLVWWAAALSRQDCELACDEGAIRRLGEAERLPYGRTLVDMIAAGRTPLLQTATTMTGGKRRVRERIRLIARRPKTVAAAALALVIVLGLAVGCTFTGAPENPAGPEESQQPVESPPLSLALSTAAAGTLRERLGNIPEDLWPEVVNRADLFDDIDTLASYFLSGTGRDWDPWLLTVYQWNRANFENGQYSAGTGTYNLFTIFGRDSESYYAIMWPTSIEYGEEDRERFNAAQEAIAEYAKQQVLNTEGVEPFSPSTPDTVPAPEPTPTSAPWETDPGQFLLDNLNASFSDGILGMRVFFNNGSGPASTAMLDSECSQEIRDLFSSYDWKLAQRPQVENVPFDYFCVEFNDNDAPYYISFSTYSNVIYAVPHDSSMDWLYFSADGAENLSRDLTALCPHPIVQCALVSCPAQETAEDTARQFMDDLFAVMLENGHIADYEVLGLNILKPSDMLTFNVRFRIKATRPERYIWTFKHDEYLVDESGWTNTIKWKVFLNADEEGKIYRLDWIE